MGSCWRITRWAAFAALSFFSYGILAGVCQAMTSIVLRFINHEFDGSLPRFLLLLPLLAAVSGLAFAVAGRLLSWTLPLDGRQVIYSLLVIGAICALVPVERMPYNLIETGIIRCLLAAAACFALVTGSRLRLPIRLAKATARHRRLSKATLAAQS